MSALFESGFPFWMLLVSLFLAAVILAAMWAATARREPLIGAGIVLALMPLAWMVERLLVTDREAIEATLFAIAAEVKNNNRAAVLRYIHSQASELRAKAEAEMGNYRFNECKINRIHEIVVSGDKRPKSAVASFNVYANGSFRVNNETISGDVFRRIELHLRQEDDGNWRVENYDHSAPLPGRRDDAGEGYGGAP